MSEWLKKIAVFFGKLSPCCAAEMHYVGDEKMCNSCLHLITALTKADINY